MSARDELTMLVLGRTAPRAADAILAAGYRKPRQVTTVEELDALPVESIVRDATGFTWDKWWDEDGSEFSWWATTGDRTEYSPKRVNLPATVLHEPEAQTKPSPKPAPSPSGNGSAASSTAAITNSKSQAPASRVGTGATSQPSTAGAPSTSSLKTR